MGKVTKGSASVVGDESQIYLTPERIEFLKGRTEKTRELFGGLLFALLRWMIASLLVINSGGAIAVLHSGRLEQSAVFLVGGFYLAGITFALLFGLASLYMLTRFMPNQGEIMILEPGLHDKRRLEEITEGLDAPPAYKDPLHLTGWPSFLCFLIGSVIFALSMTPLE